MSNKLTATDFTWDMGLEMFGRDAFTGACLTLSAGPEILSLKERKIAQQQVELKLELKVI